MSNNIIEKAPWMIDYFQGGKEEASKYTIGSHVMIYPVCPYCGNIKDKQVMIKNIYRTHSIGCSCSDNISYPNKFMFGMLKQLNIDFEREYSPKWIGKKRYDFYIPSKNIIIEMDGGLGHGISVHKRDKTKTINSTKQDDDFKDKQAMLNEIEVIRIDCLKSELDYIKNNIINSKLKDIFDLESINWNKVEEYTMTNLQKQSCDLKRDNPHYTTYDIGSILGLNYQTVIKYLKKGSELGWCEYNPKEELVRSAKKRKPHEKEIICINNNMKFKSAKECERNSVEIFGEKLLAKGICKVLTGERKTYKGYIFEFLNKGEMNI